MAAVETGRQHGIQQIENLKITGNRAHTKQAGRVVEPLLALHILLMRRERRRPHLECRKGGQTGVPQRIGPIRPADPEGVKLTARSGDHLIT